MSGLTVAIVGRPNVGKSTLFNRLVGQRQAIVDDTPGVTRDRREGGATLGDLAFRIIDTAGFEDARGDDLAARVQSQTVRAIAAADLALFLIDARAGLTPLDHTLAELLRRGAAPVLLVANKCEGRAGEAGLAEAYALGLGDPLPVSAAHGEGLGLLYDALQPFVDGALARAESAQAERAQAERAQAEAAQAEAARTAAGRAEDDTAAGAAGDDVPEAAPPLQLAVAGRPNVGKSTLINRLIGDERLVTGPEAGITRDAIAIDWRHAGRTLRLFDTAGLRRRAKVDARLEQLAGADSLRAIRFAHVVVVVIDATVGFDRQDLTIASLVVEEGRAPVLALNKWDRVTERAATLSAIRNRLDQSLPQARGLPVVPVSALTGEGLSALLPAVLRAYDRWNQVVSTGRLNRWLAQATRRQPPPAVSGRAVKLRYITQTKARPPTFVVFANRPDAVPETYLRYLAGALREAFGFDGVPLRLMLRRSKNPYTSG